MGTSEVHLPEGENLIGVCCSDELHFFSLFFFFLHFCKVTVLYDLSLTALAAAPLPNRAVRDAREIGVASLAYLL